MLASRGSVAVARGVDRIQGGRCHTRSGLAAVAQVTCEGGDSPEDCERQASRPATKEKCRLYAGCRPAGGGARQDLVRGQEAEHAPA